MVLPDRLGPYRVLRVVGTGAMGTVYLGDDPGTGRRVAIKVPHPHVRDADGLQRFGNEAVAASRLHHAHVAGVYQFGIDHDPPYLATEFVEGGDLSARLRSRGVLGVAETVELLSPVASALDHCHDRGILHRDVKPANILLGEPGRGSVLTDFGVALVEGVQRQTVSGHVVGTVAYLSPEQADGSGVGRASDLYALACVAYQCLTGSLPFPRSGQTDVLLAHLNETPPPADVLNPRLGSHVAGVLARALGKEPAARSGEFPTVSAFTTALLEAPAPRRAPPPSSPPPPPPDVDATPVQPIAPFRPPEPDRPPEPVAAERPRSSRWVLAAAALAVTVLAPAAYVGADAAVDRSEVVVDGESEVDPVDAAIAAGVQLDPEQRALLAAGPLGMLFDCVPQPAAEKTAVTAAVGCRSRDPEVSSMLLRQSGGGAVLTDLLDSRQREPGECADSDGVDGSWDGGPMSCYDNTGVPTVGVLWWGYRDTGVSLLALRDDGNGQALYAWWKGLDWSSSAGPPG